MSKDLTAKIYSVIDSHLTLEEYRDWRGYLDWYENDQDKTGVPDKIVEVAEKLKKIREEYGKNKTAH